MAASERVEMQHTLNPENDRIVSFIKDIPHSDRVVMGSYNDEFKEKMLIPKKSPFRGQNFEDGNKVMFRKQPIPQFLRMKRQAPVPQLNEPTGTSHLFIRT
jgi:hypothetical protein